MSEPSAPGKLYLVPTPIGNLEDITLRAIRILRESDLIACEDTRVTRKLLNHFDITTPTTSYHEHNEHRKSASLINRMLGGDCVALVSDAGSPGVSDPGFLLVRSAVEAGIAIEALPGPSAVIPALVASGLPSDRFVFEGFLPTKKGRKKRLEQLENETRTIVLYEAPHRLSRTLHDLAETLGNDRPAAVAREVSKRYEQIYRASLAELTKLFEEAAPRGECTVVVAGLDRKRSRERKQDVS